ncbi:hypothetical protein [Flectobacillus major]|uniref:hypothetical protein n=1 Tax=Flectobacillus major TaxID=103 RepID=UPI000405AE25|nr:hypothetical protein [Flectobacillus major]
MAEWKRKPQENQGNYQFGGRFIVTAEVGKELTKVEIIGIYYDVLKFVEEQGSIDYLQVYTDEKGRKLFFIDQLDKAMIESRDHDAEDNYCTLLFAHEY